MNIEKIDRHGSEPYKLADNGVNFYIIPFRELKNSENNNNSNKRTLEALRPEIGSYQLIQYYPCNEGDTACSEGLGFEERYI